MDKEKNQLIAVGGIVFLVVILIIIIASGGGNPTPAISESLTAGKAISLYEEAVSAVEDMKNLSMTVIQTKTTTISGDAISEERKQKITYTNIGTEEMAGCVEQTLSIGAHTFSIKEVYHNGVGYFTVADVPFRGQISQEDYLSRYVPAVPISLMDYNTLSATTEGATTKIVFSDASAPAKWLTTESTELQTCDATAYLEDGQLIRSDYNVAYSVGEIKFHIHTTVEIHWEDTPKVDIPEDPSGYTQIQYLDGPRMLEMACGYLLAADFITAKYTSDIAYQAYGDSLSEEVVLNTHSGNTWGARIDTKIVLNNTSIGQVVSEATQTERFVDGKYSISINGASAKETLTEAQMREICRNQLVGTIMLPEYIQTAKVKETKNSIRIIFTAGEDFAKLIRSDICQRLYQEPDLPEQLSQKYKTAQLECYLVLDKESGLPTSAGIAYEGIYSKDEIHYKMTSQTHQTYDLVSQTSYATIHKKPES